MVEVSNRANFSIKKRGMYRDGDYVTPQPLCCRLDWGQSKRFGDLKHSTTYDVEFTAFTGLSCRSEQSPPNAGNFSNVVTIPFPISHERGEPHTPPVM